MDHDHMITSSFHDRQLEMGSNIRRFHFTNDTINPSTLNLLSFNVCLFGFGFELPPSAVFDLTPWRRRRWRTVRRRHGEVDGWPSRNVSRDD